MKQKPTTTLTTNLIFIFLCAPTWFFAQVEQPSEPNSQPVLIEDFSTPGIPTGWTTEDASGNDVIWTWCQDPMQSSSSGTCPGIWDGDNNQNAFSSSTADNGFLTLNSDFAGAIASAHISRLTTSPVDFSSGDEAWVQFQTHLGAYNINPDGNAILRVSTNGGTNWTNYNCFPNFNQIIQDFPETRWSNNPETILINISDVAANQSEVLLQWQWTGNWEYIWSIDDVEIFDEDPRPSNDLLVTKNWYAIPPNIMTPSSQIDPIGFTADILNHGTSLQPNVKLTVEIFNQSTNTIDYRDTLEYGAIESDELVQNVLFLDEGFMADMSPGLYKGFYKVYGDSTDNNFADNILTFSFEITPTTFAKENGIRTNTTPSLSEWGPGELPSWAWGNHFYIPNGGSHLATAATFAIGNPEALNNKFITLALYEWEDDNNNSDTEFNERTLVGFNNYQITSSTPESALITVPLLTTSGDTGVSLADNGSYILMLEYAAADFTNLFICYNEENDFGASMFRTEQDGKPQYIGMVGINTPLDNTTFFSAGFGTNIAPVVRLEVEAMDAVSNYTPLSPQNKVDLFPNPVDQKLFVSLDLERSFEQMDLNVYDVNGKLCWTQNKQNIQKETLELDLQQLSSGSYLIQVVTNEGTRAKRFIKQ